MVRLDLAEVENCAFAAKITLGLCPDSSFRPNIIFPQGNSGLQIKSIVIMNWGAILLHPTE
jgi:hypothetical protein